MPLDYLHPSWQLSATLTALLGLAWAVLRLSGRWPAARAFAREFAVVTALLGIWQYVGRMVRTRSAGAMHRAEQIQTLQHRLHLPDEVTVQHLVLGHPLVVQAMNGYYAFAHLNGMGLFLVWVWWMRRNVPGDSTFHRVRNTVAGSTLICLVVQAVPVAPPRLLSSEYVDTALSYGQSVYGPYATGLASQLTAMPSVHVGWAFIIAWYVAELAPVRWKWVGAAHLVVTLLVVVATANHWWLDGAVAALIVLLVIGLQWAGRRVPGLGLSAARSRTGPAPA